MKTRLTTVESQHLIDLGVPKEKASGEIIESIHQQEYNEPRPKIFKLEDFLNGEILPIEIETYKICPFSMESWFVEGTSLWDVQYVGMQESFIQDKELINALYQLTCWYYGEYLKSEEK